MSEGSQPTQRATWISRVGWLLVPVLTAAILWVGIVAILGTTAPLEVTDGISMLPTLRSGELAVLRGVAPSALRVGAVVAVRVPPADQARYHYAPVIVHRVSDLILQGTTLMVQTQGDNHQAPEPFLVPATAVGGQLLVAIPYLGYPLLFAHSRPGEIAIGGLLLLALLYFGLTSVVDVVEDTPEGPGASVSSDAMATLTVAIQEYGQHLMSHTKVVQELGGTTEALHQAASSQNEVLASLQEVLVAMRGELKQPAPPHPYGAWEPLPSRGARKRHAITRPASARALTTPASARAIADAPLPSRRSRKRTERRGPGALGQ